MKGEKEMSILNFPDLFGQSFVFIYCRIFARFKSKTPKVRKTQTTKDKISPNNGIS